MTQASQFLPTKNISSSIANHVVKNKCKKTKVYTSPLRGQITFQPLVNEHNVVTNWAAAQSGEKQVQ